MSCKKTKNTINNFLKSLSDKNIYIATPNKKLLDWNLYNKVSINEYSVKSFEFNNSEILIKLSCSSKKKFLIHFGKEKTVFLKLDNNSNNIENLINQLNNSGVSFDEIQALDYAKNATENSYNLAIKLIDLQIEKLSSKLTSEIDYQLEYMLSAYKTLKHNLLILKK